MSLSAPVEKYFSSILTCLKTPFMTLHIHLACTCKRKQEGEKVGCLVAEENTEEQKRQKVRSEISLLGPTMSDSVSIESKESNSGVVQVDLSTGIYRLLVFFQKKVMWCGRDEWGRDASWLIRIRRPPWVCLCHRFQKGCIHFCQSRLQPKAKVMCFQMKMQLCECG